MSDSTSRAFSRCTHADSARDDRVSLTIDHDTSDRMAIHGLSMGARAVPVSDEAIFRRAMLELLPKKYPEYGPMMKEADLSQMFEDEAFADFTPETSIVPDLPAGAVVLRSFGKTYGLAGLRLGFAIGAPDPMARLKAALGPWSVAGPALHVGAQALADSGWLARMGEERARDAARLDALLVPHGRIVGGTSLFRLLETSAAAALFARLGRHGIYVRRFQNAPDRLRFGLPGDTAGWARLQVALTGDAPEASPPA